MKVEKKSKIRVTEKLRKKYGACEHNKVSYKELSKGFDQLFVAHRRVCRDNDRKGIILEKIVTEKKQQLKNIAEVKHHNKLNSRFITVDSKDLVFMALDDKEVHPSYDLGIWVKTPYFTTAMDHMFNNVWGMK